MLARSTRRGPLHALSRAQGRPVRRHHRRGLRGRAPLADARRPHRLAAAGIPARHPMALARYRRRGQDRGARRIDVLVCAADAADVPGAAGAAAPRRRLLERAARLLRAHFRALPADGMGPRQIRFHTLSKCRKAFHAANTVSRTRRRLCAVAPAGAPGRAGEKPGRRDAKAHRAKEETRPPPLARLRLPARLPPARGDRARAGGALLGQWPALLRPGLAALLPRALERRRLRPLLYADADRLHVELRAVTHSPRRTARLALTPSE